MKAGWQQATLKDLCIVDWGNTNLTKSAYVDGGEFLAVSAAGCDGRIGHKEHSKHTPVLSAIGAQCGKMFFPEEDFTAIKNTITLTPRDRCSGRFLYYLLTFVELPQRGAGQPFISKGDIQSFAVAFPSLPEQLRIVGILDDAFDGIATAKIIAEQNLQNARALFESHLQSAFTQRGEGWDEKPLEEVASIINGFAFKSGDFSPNAEVKCIKITNVGVREFVCESDGYLPADFAAKHAPVSIKSGSIVLALTRTIISGGLKVAVVPDEFDGALLNQRVAAILTKQNLLIEPFLFAYLSTQFVVDYVKERVNTLMQPNLSINDLRSMPIPLPSVHKQEQITNQISALREETQRLESLYQRKLAALDELKKSLLHQAFSGVL